MLTKLALVLKLIGMAIVSWSIVATFLVPMLFAAGFFVCSVAVWFVRNM